MTAGMIGRDRRKASTARCSALILLCAVPLPFFAADIRERAAHLVEAVDEQPQGGTGLARQLVDLGPDAFPYYLDFLAGRAEPELTPGRRAVVLQAIAGIAPSRVGSYLRSELEPSSPRRLRRAAFAALEQVGGAGEVGQALRLAGDLSGESEGSALVEELEQCLVAILTRDDRAYGALSSVVERMDATLEIPVVRAVQEVGSPKGLDLLRRMLGNEDEHAEPILLAIGGVAAHAMPPFDLGLQEGVRDYLDDEHEQAVRRAAARAAGRVQDHEAFPALIRMLNAGPADLRTAARDALRDLSKMSFNSDPRRWEAWYESERTWWLRESRRVTEDLHSGDPARVLAAIGEASVRRLHRDDLAQEIATLLGDPDAEIRHLACVGCSQLDSLAAVEPLIQSLDDVDESVRAAAEQALQAFLDTTVPSGEAAWRSWIQEVRR